MTTTSLEPEALERARIAATTVAEELREARGASGDRGRRRDRFLSDLRDAERHAVRASEQIARAVAAGLETYAERSAEAREEDGEVEAFVRAPAHALRATATMFRKAADVPEELAEALENRTFRRAVRISVLAPLAPLALLREDDD